MKKFLYLKNSISEIEKLTEMVNEFGKGHTLSSDVIHDATLALEEIVSNIVFYAYTDEDEHEIEVVMGINRDQLFFKVKDDGIAFNPLKNPEPDVSKPFEEKEIGGLGIYLVKNLMDELEYLRENEKNILTMKIPISGKKE
jgi:anti-sigma regulatory factor (Ser/Thr protein kinase)